MQNVEGRQAGRLDRRCRVGLDCHGLGRGWKKVFVILSEGKEGEYRSLEASVNSRRTARKYSRFVSERQERTTKQEARCLVQWESMTESSILAQNERWRRVLSMQVERIRAFGHGEAADG